MVQSYSARVPVTDIIYFVKTRLIGPAHGAIDGGATFDQVADKLKEKLWVKITPKAIENEMLTLKQGKKTIYEFGNEINKCTCITMDGFATGLRDTQTSLFIKARNSTNLTKLFQML